MEKDISLNKITTDICDVDYFLSVYPREGEIESNIIDSQNRLNELALKGEKYSLEADNLDYAVAASCGVLTSILDTILFHNIKISECGAIGEKSMEPFIKLFGKSNDLPTAIKNLENRTKGGFASDPNLADFGGGLQHHLRDFAHHPTIFGLIASLLTQFTGKCYGTNTAGKFIAFNVVDKVRIGKTPTQKMEIAFSVSPRIIAEKYEL